MFSYRPATLQCGPVAVRPLKFRDETAWLDLRSRNRRWLQPWEATAPAGRPSPTMSFAAFVRRDRRQWWAKRAINMGIEFEGELVGRVAITGIEWASACSGSVGYWVDEQHAGREIAPRAVALLVKYGFQEGLHRIELAVRPENEASLRVAQKLGFRDEGRRERYLFIDGDWRDHRVFALRVEDKRLGEFWDCPKAQVD